MQIKINLFSPQHKLAFFLDELKLNSETVIATPWPIHRVILTLTSHSHMDPEAVRDPRDTVIIIGAVKVKKVILVSNRPTTMPAITLEAEQTAKKLWTTKHHRCTDTHTMLTVKP